MPAYIPRLAEAHLEWLFTELPALSLTGPRATGKTTIARRHALSVARLDDPARLSTKPLRSTARQRSPTHDC
jgi:hypothetical protein